MANSQPQSPEQPPQVVVPGAGWVDVASRAITQVGFPVVIAGVLLWFVLGKFQENMELIVDRMARNTEATKALIDELKGQTGEIQKQTYELRSQTTELARQTGVLLDQGKTIQGIGYTAKQLMESRPHPRP